MGTESHQDDLTDSIRPVSKRRSTGVQRKLPVPGDERALWLFLVVLVPSRALWSELVFDVSIHALCRSFVRGATAFRGVPSRSFVHET